MYCQISHRFGDTEYFLTYDDKFYYSSKNNDNTKFQYTLQGNKLKLLLFRKETLYYVIVKEVNGGYTLDVVKEPPTSDESVIYINSQLENINYYIDAAWVKYNVDKAIVSINNKESSFNLENQFILHHEYSTDSNVNLIPLKNNLTYQGTTTNGNNLVLSSDDQYIKRPLVDFRNYTSLHTGYNQEDGTDTITLTYNFTDQVYHINDGEELVFSIPQEKEGELPPLYPYKSININDTAFIRNGAFASNVPFFADKVKKFQNENTPISNYTYLCTWLYQPDDKTPPMWLDRYYYPNAINKYEALSGESNKIFSLSFENIVDKVYFKDYEVESLNDSEVQETISKYEKGELDAFKMALQNNTYIDKKSDLTLQGGTDYKYSHISNSLVEEVYNSMQENRIDYVKNQNHVDCMLEEEVPFNGSNWRIINEELFNKTDKINFNTNLYLNPNKKMGLQLFGCDYKAGFNIQNRKDLVPFSYWSTDKTIYLINNKFQIRKEFNLAEKYNLSIKYLIVDAPFDDVYALTDDSIFILDYDLSLKSRLLYSDVYNLKSILNDNKELYKVHIVQHNKNLYAVINLYNSNSKITTTNILKIIFNKDSEKDHECSDILKEDLLKNIQQKERELSDDDLSDELRKKYTLELEQMNNTLYSWDTCVFARILSNTEYYNNFTYNTDKSLIKTEPIIKTIHIDNNSTIYGFNYDILKSTYDGDTVYGIITENNDLGADWYYIFNQSLGKLHSSAGASKYAEFSSDIPINNIAFGPSGHFALIRGFNKDSDINIPDDKKCLEIYDRSKTKMYNVPLADYSEVIALDYHRYIDSNFEEQDSFIVYAVSYSYVYIIEYQIKSEKVITHISDIPYSNYLNNLRHGINSNKLIERIDENKLYFNLFLPFSQNTLTYIWDLKESEEGWYNINVEINMPEAYYRIKVNDKLVAEFANWNYPDIFKKHSRSANIVFDNTYYFGTIGKRYGTTLNEILSDQKVDPYAILNTKTENTTLYNTSLEYYQYQANRLHFEKLQPLTITIPCGIRNGIEEIIRYFKYSKPGSISNKIKINISGIDDIKLEDEVHALKENILGALENTDYLTNIKEIEFI